MGILKAIQSALNSQRAQNLKEIYITGPEGKVYEEVKGSLPTEGPHEWKGGWEQVDEDTYRRERKEER